VRGAHPARTATDERNLSRQPFCHWQFSYRISEYQRLRS
jgi:hypothetical protein